MPKPITIKDHYREARIFTNRSILAFLFVGILAIILVSRMFFLQITQYEVHATKSDRNRINVQPVAPTRGLIFDRNGILLAENRASYSVTVTKELAKDLDHSLSILQQLLSLEDDDLERFQKRFQRRRRPYEAVPLKFNLAEDEIARVAVNQYRLPGIAVSADLVRSYPHGEFTSHTIGYVGRINEREEQSIDQNNYAGTHHIGKIGLEKFYEDQLHGTVGLQRVETNARGRILRIIDETPPVPGESLKLYMDLPTQKAAVEALGERRGAVVALDPNTGGILAFVSTPTFDPNLFVTGIDFKTYNQLNTSLDRPLFNRALQGQYPPGSTIKQFVGLAGLHYEATTWDHIINDPGYYKLENDDHLYRDWKKYGHGKVNLHIAMVQSCDTYFYDLAFKLGIDNIHDYMYPFGFGHRTEIDLLGERSGLLPSKEWKKRRHRLPWFPGETLITGIGQGFMLATPLQLANATAMLANGGLIHRPKLVAVDGEATVPELIPTIAEEDWAKMISSMEDVIHTPRGTAQSISKGIGYRMAGKTGTAQVLGIKQDEEYDEEKIAERHRDHALFVGFAPLKDPKISVAVIVENGGSGGSIAAPVARIVIDAYFESLANPPASQSPSAQLSLPGN